MARSARTSLPGYPRLVVQRCLDGSSIFGEQGDFEIYLTLLWDYAGKYRLEIWAYCLMTDNVRFVCLPKSDGGLSRAFNTIHMRYAQRRYSRNSVTGPLWRGRFLSCMLDGPSALEEVRQVENAPVRAGLAAKAEDYPWSSARCHVLGADDPVVCESPFLKDEIGDWSAYLSDVGDERILTRTRQRLKTGRPAGEDRFVHDLEERVGRRLLSRPRGRPRRSPKTAGGPDRASG